LLKKATLWGCLGAVVVFFTAVANADLLIRDGYVRGLPPGQPNTAVFMRLVNDGGESITINHSKSDSSESAEFHGHKHHNGLMRMEQVESITIPAGEEFVFEPGDHHLMLLGLIKPLRDGDQVTINLQATNGQSFTAQLPVRSVLNEHRHH
jgi:copper(I)-binding protein